MNVEIKKQSKLWMYRCSPNEPKKFGQTSACQNADGIEDGIHAARDHKYIIAEHWKNCRAPF
jgi:hypothetical protein